MCRKFDHIPLIKIVIPALLLWATPMYSFRISSKIYTDLDNRYFCFTRLNATHQIGCSTSDGGNAGLAKLVRDEELEQDIDFILSKGDQPPYVAIITSNNFNMFTLTRFQKDSSRVAGVVVLDQNRPEGFSSDRSCPNEQYSLYVNDAEHRFCSKQKWNKPTPDHDDGILFQHWPFPIFLLRNKTEIDILIKKTEIYGKEWPKLALELTSPMSAAVSSISCIRRSWISANAWYNMNLEPEMFCEPLGGMNIFDHTIDISNTKELKQNSIVVLATRLDSFSMFDGLSPGSDSVMSSLITILSTAELLNRPEIKAKIREAKDKALLISIFDGEAFDYIGSSQAAFQMQHEVFPLPTADGNNKYQFNLKHLSHFIELDQVAPHSSESPYNIFLHKHLSSDISGLVKLFGRESQDLNGIKVNEIQEPMPLPPSSAQSFLKLRDDKDFKVVVLTNHEKEYTNKYYNSFYEDGTIFDKENVVQKLKALSTLVARAVFELVTNNRLDRKVEANETLIKMMYECFLVNSNCHFFKILDNSNDNANEEERNSPFTSFVSVYRHSKPLRQYVRAALNFLSGEKVAATGMEECINKGQSDPAHTYLWQNGDSMLGECIMSNVYYIDSLSPAFDPETSTINETMIEQYGVWTESRWTISSIRMYVVASQKQQIIVVVLGLVLWLSSFLTVYHLSKNSEYYFDSLVADEQDENINITNASTIPHADPSENYPDWVRSPNEIEYSAITNAERSNSGQVFT